MDIALRDMGIDHSLVAAIHDMLDFVDETEQQQPLHPSKAYVRDTKAMKATPADIVEFPNFYRFVVDMPGLKPEEIKVHLEDDNLLVVSGDRRREKLKDEGGVGGKYVKMERRFGKSLKKFLLPENANTEKISAGYEHGVLTVSVEKSPPPEQKKPKLIEVKVGGASEGTQETRQEGKGEQSATATAREVPTGRTGGEDAGTTDM